MHLKKDVKDIDRLRQILTVFFEEGFGFYLARTKLHLHLPWIKRARSKIIVGRRRVQAEHLRKSFERLGPTFVKFGQLLSLRSDLVPLEFCEEFEKLQDHVPSFPYSQAKKIVEEELGKPIKKLFKNFEKKPLASASIAQVHRATLKNGKQVVVKVQRPNIKEIIDKDLDILFFIAKQLENHFSSLKNLRPTDVVKEFAFWTRKEINFKNEASNALRLKEAMKINSQIKIPNVYPQYSSRKVLVLEYINGFKIDDFVSLEKNKINKKKIALTYFNSILQQALLVGFFHADPHPANIFVLKNSKLVYLDYGIMGEIPEPDRKKLINFISSIPEGNSCKSFEIILSLAKEMKNEDVEEFRKEGTKILEKAYHDSIGETSFGKAIYQIIGIGARYGVIFDPNHVLVAKAVYQAEGLGLKLYPQFKISEGFKIFYDDYVKMNYSPFKLLKKFETTLLDNKNLLLEFPEHVIKIIKKLESVDQPVVVDNNKIKGLEERLEQEQQKHSYSLVILILFLASMFLLYLEGYQKLFGLSLSKIMIVVTVLVLIYFVVAHKRNR